MEKNLTIHDLISMGYNIDALEEYYQGIYTNEELKQILNNELEIMYTEENHLPEYKGNKLIPKYKKNLIHR